MSTPLNTYLKKFWNIKQNWEDDNKNKVEFESSSTEVIATKFGH